MLHSFLIILLNVSMSHAQINTSSTGLAHVRSYVFIAVKFILEQCVFRNY
jgi:hypothetical protein